MMGAMDAYRARELLAAERTRLEQALVGRGHTDVGELSEQDEPADQATELYQDEFDEGLAEDLREEPGRRRRIGGESDGVVQLDGHAPILHVVSRTALPWPKRPWLTVRPALAPSTWRPSAWPRSCQVTSQT